MYFPHYVTYPTAPFHKEIFDLTEDDSIQNIFLVAFRGSGKSTIFTTSYPIWAMLGRQQKKFIIIASQTIPQAKQHMANLRRELESNEVLKRDLGPFREINSQWGMSSLVFSRFNTQIMAVSVEQNIRGLRHGQHRPDLIICDDIEDSQSVKTREGRDKVFKWLTGDVIPAGGTDTRLVVVGNLLHEDSLLRRLEDAVKEERRDGVFRSYPLVNSDGRILWPGRYRNAKDVEKERAKVGNDIAWHREYLLHIVPDVDQVIHGEWIKYYKELPKGVPVATYVGVDLAVSEKDAADYTAMVAGHVYETKRGLYLFILPNPVNEHLTFPRTVEQIKSLDVQFSGLHRRFIIEEVGYQSALIQHLRMSESILAEGSKVGNQDKRSRLANVTHLIHGGQILFPERGAEKLIDQLVHFGVEKHDDLADAFAHLALHFLNEEVNRSFVGFF